MTVVFGLDKMEPLGPEKRSFLMKLRVLLRGLGGQIMR